MEIEQMGRSDFLFSNPSFIEGIARILDFGGSLNVYNESPSDKVADEMALWMDWRVTGDDIAYAIIGLDCNHG